MAEKEKKTPATIIRDAWKIHDDSKKDRERLKEIKEKSQQKKKEKDKK